MRVTGEVGTAEEEHALMFCFHMSKPNFQSLELEIVKLRKRRREGGNRQIMAPKNRGPRSLLLNTKDLDIFTGKRKHIDEREFKINPEQSFGLLISCLLLLPHDIS